MSCRRARELLNDYVDGALPADSRVVVEKHLADCSDCREELSEIRALLASTQALPREIEPGRDLWPGVERQIRQPQRAVASGSWWSESWVGLAAAAVLVVAVTLQVARQEEPVASGAAVPVAKSVATASDYARVSEEVRASNGLMQVREDLMRSIAERRGSLDAETQEMIDRNLALIDQAISEIHYALEENPDNQGLEFLLAATYQREVDFLKQINLL